MLAEGAMTPEEVQALVARKKGGNKRKWQELIGGPPAMNPIAEAERLEQLKLEAALRPPRVGRPPSSEMQTMTQSQFRQHADAVLSGEVIPAAKNNTPPPAPGNYQLSETRLALEGLEEIAARIEDGYSMREICVELGVRTSHLNRWIDSIPEGATRVRDARRKAAQAWLDRGLEALENAHTLQDLAKAREIATMCRKYASIADPSYSDRVQVDTTIKEQDPSAIDRKLALIVSQVASKTLPKPEEA